MSQSRWVANRRTHGTTVHERNCPHVDETMTPMVSLRGADRTQAVAFCRMAGDRVRLCRRCARRNLD